MMTDLQPFHMAIVMVCVEIQVIEGVRSATQQVGWDTTEMVLDTYVSTRRRPYFGERIRSADGCVALIDFTQDVAQASATALYLQQVFGSRIAIVALGAETNRVLMLQAMRAGCTEFIDPSKGEAALYSSFQRIEEQLGTRDTAKQDEGVIISMIGAKGGVGTTTLAVHLAAYLVQRSGKKVLLIDNQAQFGHVCIYLGIDGTNYQFQEVVRNVNRLDSELLKGFVAKHPSGLDVLSSPDVGQVARGMHPDDVTATLEYLRTEYDIVLVDCAGRLDQVSRAVIALSSQVYVIATPEISAVRDLSRYVDDLRASDDGLAVKVVINRYSSQFAVGLTEIERVVRMPVAYSVPNSYIELVRSANLGEPMSIDQKNGFTAELSKWVDTLVGAQETSPALLDGKKRKSILAGLMKAYRSFTFGVSTHVIRKRA